MKRITQNKYYKKGLTKEWLKENGFHYSDIFTIAESKAFTYKFPVYKYGNKPLLMGEILIYEDTKEVYVNVYNENDYSKSVEFYQDSLLYNAFVKSVEKKIIKELRRLKIVKYKTHKKEENK